MLVHDDPVAARQLLRRQIAAYLTVPVYRAFHEWLGREKALRGLWDGWAAGDRAGAARSIPDEVVDELCVHGSLADCRAGIRRYVEHGVTTPVIALLNDGPDLSKIFAGLAPAAAG